MRPLFRGPAHCMGGWLNTPSLRLSPSKLDFCLSAEVSTAKTITTLSAKLHTVNSPIVWTHEMNTTLASSSQDTLQGVRVRLEGSSSLLQVQ